VPVVLALLIYKTLPMWTAKISRPPHKCLQLVHHWTKPMKRPCPLWN